MYWAVTTPAHSMARGTGREAALFELIQPPWRFVPEAERHDPIIPGARSTPETHLHESTSPCPVHQAPAADRLDSDRCLPPAIVHSRAGTERVSEGCAAHHSSDQRCLRDLAGRRSWRTGARGHAEAERRPERRDPAPGHRRRLP